MDHIRRFLGRFGLRPGRVGSWLLFIFTGLYAVVGTAQRGNFPEASFWTEHSVAASWALLGIALILQLGAALRVKILEDRADRDQLALHGVQATLDHERELASMQDQFRGLLIAVSARSARPLTTLGVSVWRVSASGETLERLALLRLHGRPRSGVAWTKGKGVIGRCWAESRELLIDLTKFRGLSQADFEALDDETRVGMEWNDYQQTAGYSAVWATPVRDEPGNLLGCISIDCDHPDSTAGLENAMRDKAVLGVIEILRNSVARLVVKEGG
jgi:hypothetical protein